MFSIFIHRNLVSDFQGKQENEFLFLFDKKKIEKKSCGVSLNILPLHRNCHNSSVGRAFHS